MRRPDKTRILKRRAAFLLQYVSEDTFIPTNDTEEPTDTRLNIAENFIETHLSDNSANKEQNFTVETLQTIFDFAFNAAKYFTRKPRKTRRLATQKQQTETFHVEIPSDRSVGIFGGHETHTLSTDKITPEFSYAFCKFLSEFFDVPDTNVLTDKQYREHLRAETKQERELNKLERAANHKRRLTGRRIRRNRKVGYIAV